MRPHTGDPPAVGCVQRSGTRAVMRSFLLPDFHPETMINYFWCSGSLVRTPLPFGSDGNLFPRFLGKEEGGGGRELPANHSLMSLIRTIGQFHGFSETLVGEQLWNFLGERREGGETEARETIGEIVDRCIISSGERLNFSVAFPFPSLQFSCYIFLSPAKRKFYF